jgi:hypothetical protein
LRLIGIGILPRRPDGTGLRPVEPHATNAREVSMAEGGPPLAEGRLNVLLLSELPGTNA